MELDSTVIAGDGVSSFEGADSDADKGSENGQKVFLCYSCSQECSGSSIYRCKTCIAEDNAENHVHAEKCFCHVCIVGNHLRQKHAIIDHKGYEPSVCKVHKNLDEFFCKACISVFCSSCTREHISHEFQTLEEKAIEVRKQVFELITSNETLMKPLKRKEVVAEQSLRKKEFYNSLRTAEGIDTLSRIYTEVIQTRSTDWSKRLKEVPKEYAKRSEELLENIKSSNSKSDEQLTQMKELLKNSEGFLVKSFIEAEYNFAQSIKEREKQLETHTYMRWTIDIETMVKNSIKTAMKEYTLSQLEEREIFPLLLAVVILPTAEYEIDCKEIEVTASYDTVDFDHVNEIFDVNIGQDECRFLILKHINHALTVQKIVLKRVHAKFIVFRLGFLAICLKSNIVYVYSLSEKRFVYQFEVSATDVPLSLNRWIDLTFSFLLWSNERSQVQIQGRSDTLYLSEQPTQISRSLNVLAFLHSGDIITIWDRNANVRLDISNVQHGLSSIDNLKLTDSKTLFLFDYRLKVIVKFQFDVSSEASVSCSLQTVFKLTSFVDILPTFVTVVGKTIVGRQSESDDWYSAELPE